MRTREIDRQQWDDFMAALSNQCLNRPVKIEIQSQELGAQTLVSEKPFLGISPELKGSAQTALDIEVGKVGSTEAFMHEVPGAQKVQVQENEEGVPVALDIESEDPETHLRITTILTWS